MKNDFQSGIRSGIPICVGYFAVSFGFGALAVRYGISTITATLISLTNLTSAGQFAGIEVMAKDTGLWLMILTQLVINSRYFLMGISLSQKLQEHTGFLKRCLIAFVNTDEIFAVAMSRRKPLTLSYMWGLSCLPILGWTSGTLLGALAGTFLPLSMRTALGVALYGMFIAVFVPKARTGKPVFITVLNAILLSSVFYYTPYLKDLPTGISVVISTIISAAVSAFLFPLAKAENNPDRTEEVLSK